MATKKRTPRRKHLSSGAGLSKKVKTHRRRHPRKKGMLSEIFNASTATASAKTALSGGIGGYGYGLLSKSMESMKPLEKGAIALGASFLVASVLKMPNIAAGISGAYGYELAQKGLGEMQDHDYSTGLEAAPEFMDENGEPMYLAGDGKLYYLDEMDEMNEMNEMDEMDQMNESTYLADMYPNYVHADY